MHYRQIWEKYHGKKIPKNYEIHHIDGNRKNNNPENLLCVSIEDHLVIHENRNEWGAVQAILLRMENSDKEKIKQAASVAQKQKWNNGVHNFQKNEEKRMENSKKHMKERIEKYGIAFLGIENTVENARNAGKIAAEKKAGFLDTNSNTHGSNYVKNTYWWTNIKTKKRMRSKTSPGKNWIKGMKNE